MPSGFVHDVQTLVALGRTYHQVHRHKDAAAAKIPGRCHRRIRHGWYHAFGRVWNLVTPFPESVKNTITKCCATSGAIRAEEYMASLGHDYSDRLWDFEQLGLSERNFTRKYSESFWVWIVLNPLVLRDWAGVDVFDGRIERHIDGELIWEDAPEVMLEYQDLRARAHFLLRVDKRLCQIVKVYGEPAV